MKWIRRKLQRWIGMDIQNGKSILMCGMIQRQGQELQECKDKIYVLERVAYGSSRSRE